MSDDIEIQRYINEGCPNCNQPPKYIYPVPQLSERLSPQIYLSIMLDRILPWTLPVVVILLLPFLLFVVWPYQYLTGGNPWGGGCGMSQKDMEEDIEFCKESHRLVRDENGKIVHAWEAKLSPEEKEELRLKRLSWNRPESPGYQEYLEKKFAEQNEVEKKE